METGTVVILSGLSLLLLALFAGAETTLLFLDRARLRGRLMNNGVESPRPLESFVARPQWFFAVIFAGGALSLALFAVPVALHLFERFERTGLVIAFFALCPLLLFFGQALRRAFFARRADRYALPMLALVRLFYYPLLPAIALLMGLSRLSLLLLGRGGESVGFWFTREHLKDFLAEAAHPILGDREGRQMVDRIFDFSETVVEEVMIPLVEVEALEESATAGEAARRVLQKMFSRYPVYRERIDNVIGQLESTDLLEARGLDEPISAWLKPVRYVPYNKPIDELLFNMQKENYSFAVVVDEFGGCIGVITREDIVEEIVGEIEDEHDEPTVLYHRLDRDRVMVNARMEVYDINELLGWGLPEGEFETLGGFLLSRFRRVPRAGERLRFRDLMFTISEATDRAIVEVMVEKVQESPGPPETSP